jgi:aspartate carbamoyltransferase catalytic subunit
MNRGVEIDAEAAGDERSVITGQVANGVAVRMAVLFLLLGGGSNVLEVGEPPDEALPEVQQPEAARA